MQLKETLSGLGYGHVSDFDLNFGVCKYVDHDSSSVDYCGTVVKNTDHEGFIQNENQSYGKATVIVAKHSDMSSGYLWLCAKHVPMFRAEMEDVWWIYEIDVNRRAYLMNPKQEQWTMVVRVDVIEGMNQHAVKDMVDRALRSALADYSAAGKSQVTTIDSMPVEVE